MGVPKWLYRFHSTVQGKVSPFLMHLHLCHGLSCGCSMMRYQNDIGKREMRYQPTFQQYLRVGLEFGALRAHNLMNRGQCLRRSILIIEEGISPEYILELG